MKEDFECKKHLYGVFDMGFKLLFRFRSGTHGPNKELGRHSTRNNSKACIVCECESAEHVLWEYSEYKINLDGILQNWFHLKSSFYNTKFIFTRVFGNAKVILIISFQKLRHFCEAYEIFAKKALLLFRFIF